MPSETVSDEPSPARRQNMSDQYTPPPRHRERSGAIVRFLIVGVLLAGAVWGYMAYSDGPGLIEATREPEILADSSYDALPPAAPAIDPEAASPDDPAATETPAPRRAPAAQPAPAPAPPPSTTIGTPPAG
jgi:hypothetical protein